MQKTWTKIDFMQALSTSREYHPYANSLFVPFWEREPSKIDPFSDPVLRFSVMALANLSNILSFYVSLSLFTCHHILRFGQSGGFADRLRCTVRWRKVTFHSLKTCSDR